MKLPRALNAPLFSGRIRSVPEDFVVEELPAFEATGEGEHLLLSIRKRGMNTAFCAQNIARWAGIDERDVSYAGMKDRHALTTQRFSVRLPKKTAPDVTVLNNEECQVLEAVWHNRKLARGALAGNRFVLTLRELSGERECAGAGFARHSGAGRAELFRRTALRHGAGQCRQGARHVRGPACRPRQALDLSFRRTFVSVQPAAG